LLTEKKYTVEKADPSLFFSPDHAVVNYMVESFPKLTISSRGKKITLKGDEALVRTAENELRLIEEYLMTRTLFDEDDFKQVKENASGSQIHIDEQKTILYGPNGKVIKARTRNQRKLVHAVAENDIVFAVGPAGTGKTYTAVALAVQALKNKQVKRIVLARPAVEAGESLGFLPGDMKEKVDPYLRPLYDALLDMIPVDKYNKYLENRIIEVAPLAFMRGRTLNHCFAILDEAQNATETQLKMFLTRMGPSAKVVITGDLSQIDLPRQQKSGLPGAVRKLQNIDGIEAVELDTTDVVRHRLVKEIIKAYQ
jgi:phosphate starvation-inducible PhoH-like protein